MNLKKLLSLLLCLIMVFTCLVPLTACNDGDGDGDGDGGGNVICTQHIDANNDGKCDNCGTALTPGKSNYTVTVKTAGGMPMSGVTVYLYGPGDDELITRPKSTDDKGTVVFTDVDTRADYSVALDGVPDGYNVKGGLTAADRYPMGPTGTQITLLSQPYETDAPKKNYNVGDVMFDFTLTDVNGQSYKLSELLETKKMVMLNFWYIDCSWCNKEFPGLNDSYKNYSDKVEVLALNDYATDSESEVKSFPNSGLYADENELVFPFFKITDANKGLTIGNYGGFAAGSTGYPTTIIIDRYGLICMIEQGAIVGEAKWNKIFDYFTSDKYTQKLIENADDLTPPEKPNIPWGGSDGIASNFNSAGLNATYSPDKDEYSWPFVPAEVEGVKVVKPSNTSDNSYAILYASVQLKPGQAVMFDYFSSCEYGNDRMVIIVGGDDICSLTGINGGSIANLEDWEECCAYVDPRPITETNKDELITYEVAFVYLKDTETSEGDDTVYLKNLQVIGVDEITTKTYIIRDAVSGPTDDNSGYTDYVKYVYGSDGYYHVEDANGGEGPLLLANFLGYTKFDSNKTMSQRVIGKGELIVDDVDMYNNWMVYANASSNSAINGYTPVTKELKSILDAYCQQYRNEAGKDNHAEIWLQLCTYYDAYGLDENNNPTPHVPDPIKGLTTISAFETDFPENPEADETVSYTVTYDRVIMPRGYLYKFTPKTSGAYRVTSHSTSEVHGWIFTGTSLEWISDENGSRTVLTDFEEEERYCPALLIDNGDGTFTRDYKNVSLVAYMEAGKDYYIDIAFFNIYEEGSFDFDITYIGEEFDAFVMASPGPITYTETSSGGIGGLIALGIDYAFKDEGGTLYAYEVIKRDALGNPEIWGNKIYADLYFPTIPFPTQSITEIVELGAFDFRVSDLDRDAIQLLETIRKDGRSAIITKWVNSQVSNPGELWESKGLDNIVLLLQAGKDVSSYPTEDVATAREALAAGERVLKKKWGVSAIGSAEDWTKYSMDSALDGTLSSDATTKAKQQEILAAIDEFWFDIYQMDDVAIGTYHGTGTDATEIIRGYIAAMENDTVNNPERQGCVAVTKELSEILHQLYAKYVFEDAQHDWLKFCFYYKHLGA